MKIKYLVLPLLLLSQGASAINSKYKCDQVIFSGLDINHQKSVKVCLSGKKVSYTFGSINSAKNDLDMIITPDKASWDYYVNGKNKRVSIKTITVKTGPYTYKMTTGKNEGELEKSLLRVYKDNVTGPINFITLDNETIINEVNPTLRQHGIPFVKDEGYEYKKRNPADTFTFS